MAGQKWLSTKDKETGKPAYPGVRYYKHPTRKNGVVFDRYFAIRYQKDGKRIEEGIGWATEKDPEDDENWTEKKAALVLERLKSAAKHGKKEAPTRLAEQRKREQDRRKQVEQERLQAEKEAITLTAFFQDIYLTQAMADKKKTSVVRETGLFNNYILPVMGTLPMRDIAPFHLEKIKRDMAAKRQSPRSIEYCLAVIRQIFNTAKRLGMFIGDNPANNVKFPKPDNGRMRFLTHEEAEGLLAALKVKSIDVHDMALLSFNCGLRWGEITNLQWGDINFEKGTLAIKDAKAGSRYAFLTEQAASMLKGREKGKPTEYVFQNSSRGKVGKISHTFYRTVDELGLNEGITDPRQKVCFHSCRHSYASWLVEQGQDLYTVQRLLGHKTNVMTQRYSHISENKFKEAARALSAAITAGQKEAEATGQVIDFPR
ncbi:MAG: tyrosine-type recombinase/integrase [Smithella sp.]|jgi:integrase|nr:tyrosine-type recombinase/integrase [Smithella sp.]